MERKRKLPARAAARIEQAAKKGRTSTPADDYRSATPSSALNDTPARVLGPSPDASLEPNQPAPPPLPTSIQPGKPLPTVEDAQAEDLSLRDYQSIQESGVLAESLARSRQRWISDGLFERYWTKPTRKKGVTQEDPKNPPKESMTKVGQVTISLEPHYFEATMYAVKDPNKPAPQPVFRPILQYGPPNGAMPPPPTPTAKPPPPKPTLAASQSHAPTAAPPVPSAIPSPVAPPQQPNAPMPTMGPASHPPPPSPSAASHNSQAMAPVPTPPQAVASPRVMESMLSQNTASQDFAPRPSSVPSPITPQAPQIPIPSPSPANSAAGPSQPPRPPTKSPAPLAPTPTPSLGASRAPQPPTAVKPAPAAPGADPIIVTLAEKANEDPQLRDLMKRVANGNAPKDELARFQAIIDQITAESKKKPVVQGPSAERVFIDGKSLRYFADEVDTIASIVLRTNPKQTSAHLSVPPDSNPLVVELVKAALDDTKTMERVRRIAKNVAEGSDTTDLKDTLERLKAKLEQRPMSSAGSSKPNGNLNDQASPAVTSSHTPAPQQALRSKGPPPAAKPDVTAVLFDFAGGNGDRYQFPKFSIVQQVQTSSGTEIIASFLIVRKGSVSEYGYDPTLDYYQPITVRISSTQSRYLEYFSRVVAPQEEVRRYMEDVMDNTTRAEYILLAMRLPRPEKEAKDDGQESGKDSRGISHHATPEGDVSGSEVYRKGLTWKKDKAMKLLAKPAPLSNNAKPVEEKLSSYENFIASVGRKEPKNTE